MNAQPKKQDDFSVVTGTSFYKPLLRFLKELPKDYVGTMADVQAHHGPLVHLKLFGGLMNMAFVSDATVNRELFVRHTDALGKSPSQIQTFLYAAGNSVATAHGDDWRTKRKEANALFARKMVEAPCAGQVHVVRDHVATLPDATMDAPMDAMGLAKRLAALTSSRGILGRTITMAEADTQIAFSNAARDRFNAESAHMFARPDWMLAPWRRDLTRQKDRVFPIVQAAIDELRTADAPNDGLMNHYVNGTFVTSNDTEMLTIMVGLLMGAQDNIASALGWVLAFLAHDPALQAELRGEIGDGPMDADHLNRCALLRSTVAEVLRMRPPAQANQPRQLCAPVTLAGHDLPKGTFVLNSIYNMHHDAAAWPEPDSFDPRRFMDQGLTRMPNYAPFGHGPRNCVAQGMATQQLMASVAGLLAGHQLAAVAPHFPTMEQTPFLVPADFDIRITAI